MAHEHEHEHTHTHDHEHAHTPDPDRDPDPDPNPNPNPNPARPPSLPRSSGTSKLLFLDAPSGLAGDMIIAALVDLGVPRSVVSDAIDHLGLAGFHIHFGTRARSGIVGTTFDVHVDPGQPTRTYASVRALIEASPLDSRVKALAAKTFLRLAEAEARVHRTSLDDVHFHEVGAVDAIVDVVGSAAALEYLGAELVVSPLPMGRGFVKAAHGKLPLPAPATVECLAGFATYDAGVDFEFVTPTGAAIVGAHARGSERWPSMVVENVGWGAGHAEVADRPNLLRAVLGSAAQGSPTARERPTHAVIEANVDDATGELAATFIDSLLGAGALDAWATPITMKKGRPALTIAAIAPIDRADAVGQAMLRETTSLGLRRHDVVRMERPRTTRNVETPYGRIPVKIAGGPFGPPQVKPEFDSCAAAAAAHGVPVREVLRAAMVSAAAQLEELRGR